MAFANPTYHSASGTAPKRTCAICSNTRVMVGDAVSPPAICKSRSRQRTTVAFIVRAWQSARSAPDSAPPIAAISLAMEAAISP